jgi:dTDP-4-dehydrorhamnose reductase
MFGNKVEEKILVTGSSGLVGSRFCELYSKPEQIITPSEEEFNLLNPDSIKKYLELHRVKYIINFGAFTDVLAAESQRDDKTSLCWDLNVNGVRHVFDNIDPSQTHFIQISTDMIFSGSESDPGPYTEDHVPESDSRKITWYGYTKSQAENIVSGSGAIIRICNPVRADFPAKSDYFRKPLSLFDQGKLYPLFSDQHITISYIDEISAALEKIIKKNLKGTFHVSSSDVVTPFDVITKLLKKTRGVTQSIEESSILSLNNPVRYPQFAGLSCKKTESALDLKFSSTSQIIDNLISQGLALM